MSLIYLFKILDVACWPKDKETVESFANNDIVPYAYYLQTLLEKEVHFVSVGNVLNELLLLKNLRYMLLTNHSSSEFWMMILISTQKRFPTHCMYLRFCFFCRFQMHKLNENFLS